ncbi:hypothetical protein FVE85_6500 [Porphyridium purpureum]|uniref:Uncharacterized protein n=1 Tax=Porphyridium purpureum TaxID=35688 RepID=A0A5J4Z6G1_PORPP|nr:hypothetical protein FVE85_6500 [Porphyridium purpureum]|eukprot:POR0358..scf295_1
MVADTVSADLDIQAPTLGSHKRSTDQQEFCVGAFRFRKKAKHSAASEESQHSESLAQKDQRPVRVNADAQSEKGGFEGDKPVGGCTNSAGSIADAVPVKAEIASMGGHQDTRQKSSQDDHVASVTQKVGKTTASSSPAKDKSVQGNEDADQTQLGVLESQSELTGHFTTLQRVLLLLRMSRRSSASSNKTHSPQVITSSADVSLRQAWREAMASQFDVLFSSTTLPNTTEDENAMQSQLLSCAENVASRFLLAMEQDDYDVLNLESVIELSEGQIGAFQVSNPINKVRAMQLELLEQAKARYEEELSFWEDLESCRHDALIQAQSSMEHGFLSQLEVARSAPATDATNQESESTSVSHPNAQHLLEQLELACDVLGTTFKRLQRKLRQHHASHDLAVDFLASQVFMPCSDRQLEHPKTLILGLR